MIDSPTVSIGLDLGTSAVKAVALDPDGTVLSKARRAYPSSRPEPGAAEQNPTDWWFALEAVLSEVAQVVPPQSWAVIGLTGMLPTLVELDSDNLPMSPAITWEDSRAEPEADVYRTAIGDDRLYTITGQRIDGRYLAPMHARLRGLGLGGATVAGAKDVVFAYLTGTLLTDPSTAAGFGVFDIEGDRWDAELLAANDIPAVPPVASAATAATILPRWRDRWGLRDGFPVILGAADSVLGALGVGATAPGDVAVIAGTSAIILGISDTPVRDSQSRYLVTPMTGDSWGLEMDLLAVGSAFDGIAALLGLPGPAALLDAAATVAPAEAPLFLPYLAPGEQGALWDPDLTGTVHGLALGMGPGHLGRALLTGVVVEMRRCIGILAAATGRAGPILLGGGSALSPLLWQDLADATGREVQVDTLVSDHSAIGAALFGATSVGLSITRPGQPVSVAPRPVASEWWATSAERHDRLRTTLPNRSRR